MNELSIVHYCHPNCSPLNSITRMSKSDAFAKAKELSDSHSGTAFGRFADFDHYYPKRIETEEWLYHGFLKLGGQPETKHPLYFVLQGNDFLFHWFDKGEIVTIPLHRISPAHISFTFGDSMAKFDTRERRDPFGKEQLMELLHDFHGDVDLFLGSVKEQYNYIEVQLWSDVYVEEWLGRMAE
ncbi:hypothetical protein [Gorillibacterium sp. CAU 1737]|uniref:hypothetical protein n=1 Tax=Gorillibacterium sp. CAU 1737 TaxID=3140362 RepID=UPI0032604E69